jgi:hypothetical protein
MFLKSYILNLGQLFKITLKLKPLAEAKIKENLECK